MDFPPLKTGKGRFLRLLCVLNSDSVDIPGGFRQMNNIVSDLTVKNAQNATAQENWRVRLIDDIAEMAQI
jgi:hypothetical protein